MARGGDRVGVSRVALMAMVLALPAAACRKQERRPPVSRPQARAPAPDLIDAQLQDADPLAELPALTELPALDLTPVAPRALRDAKALAAAALARHLAGDLTGAIPDYLRALALDPGHVMARYNLASAWARTGDRGRALAVLRQFRDAACPVCIGRLTRATRDSDWETLWKDPGFRALTTGLPPVAGNIQQMTMQIADAFRNGDAAPLATVLHPRTPVLVSLADFGCIHQDCGLMNTWDERRVIGPAALTRWMSQFRGRHAATDVPDCSGECCSLSDKVVNASDGHATLLVACYHLDSGDVAFPHSLIFAANAAQLGP